MVQGVILKSFSRLSRNCRVNMKWSVPSFTYLLQTGFTWYASYFNYGYKYSDTYRILFCWLLNDGRTEWKRVKSLKVFVAISAPAVFILFFKYEYWQLKLWKLLYIPVCLGQALYIDTTLHVVPGSSSMVNFKSDETYWVKLFKGIFLRPWCFRMVCEMCSHQNTCM